MLIMAKFRVRQVQAWLDPGLKPCLGELSSLWALFIGRFLPLVQPAKEKESLEAPSDIPFSCRLRPSVLVWLFATAVGR